MAGALEQPTPTRQAEIDASNRLAQAMARGDDTSIPTWQYGMAASNNVRASNEEAKRIADSSVNPTTGRPYNDMGDRFTGAIKGMFKGASGPGADAQYDALGNVIDGGTPTAPTPTTPAPGTGSGRSAGPGGPLVGGKLPTYPGGKAGSAAAPSPAPTAPEMGGTPTADTGGFTSIKTERGETPYDMHTRVAHDVSRMLMMGGHHEGAMRALGQYRELSAAATAHKADEAIRALSMGDVRKAIEVHNHDIPNGEQIIGYKQIDGGFEFQYASGKTEKAPIANIAQSLSQYKDPAYVAQLGMKTAIAREGMLKEMAVEKYKHLGRMEVEQFKADKDIQKMLKAHQIDANTIAGISRGTNPMDTATYVRMKSGGMFKLVEEPGIAVNGKPGPVTTKLVPVTGAQIPAGLQSGQSAPGVAGGGGVSWQVNKLFSGE